VQEGADALVVDVGSEHTLTVSRDEVHRLASAWRPVRLHDGGWSWAQIDSGDSPAGEQLR
jgi:hypothetical protein